MLRDFTDSINSVSLARDYFRRKYPDEVVLFSSAVTILETRSTSPVGWSFKRFLQRRGNVIITGKRLLLKSNPLSLMTLILASCIVPARILPETVIALLERQDAAGRE